MAAVKLPDPSTLPEDNSGQAIESAMASAASAQAEPDVASKDVVMSDAPPENAPSPVPAQLLSTNAPSPAPPARTGTPSKNLNGEEVGKSSRDTSQHPDPGFAMPSETPPHGHSVRKYLNTKVTGVLLDGMKQIAKEQPRDPLRALGEFLIQKSKELENAP